MSGGSHGHYCQNRNPKPWRMLTAVSISWAQDWRPITLFFSPSLACVFFLLMDLVSPTEQLCYVRCTYCNTVLAVGVPCKRMMDAITVKCGHCNHLSVLGPRPIMQSLAPSNHHLVGLQGPCTDCLRGQPSPPSSSTSSEQMIQKPQFVMKPPEKKHRMPSAYNRFMKEEIQRIKAAKPDIPHREAFSMAAKNWAKCDPRCSTIVSPSDTNELAPVPDSERSGCSRMESSSVCEQLEQKEQL